MTLLTAMAIILQELAFYIVLMDSLLIMFQVFHCVFMDALTIQDSLEIFNQIDVKINALPLIMEMLPVTEHAFLDVLSPIMQLTAP